MVISGWMKALAHALNEKLDSSAQKLFQQSEKQDNMSHDEILNSTCIKLDALAKVLDLYPYDADGQKKDKLLPVSHDAIEPVHMICPEAMECETMACNPRSLLQATKRNDIPCVRLIKGTTIHKKAYVLSGRCPDCHTIYHADHERALQSGEENRWNRVYSNTAKYLKVGRNIWVDRIFSKAVMNGMYSFHASAAAYAEFWSNSFAGDSKDITRRQIWHTFIQESVRTISAASDIHFELLDGLSINEVTKEAFNILGEDGMIRAADQHECSECAQPYKKTADTLTGDDPTALVGVDEQREVPVLVGDGADLAVQNAAQAREDALNSAQAADNMEVDDDDTDDDPGLVTMVVMDGVVMGPLHCSYGDCTSEVLNARGGVFCGVHEAAYGAKCQIKDCQHLKVAGMQTCHLHREEWRHHTLHHGRRKIQGLNRVLRRPNEEVPWMPGAFQNTQAHDEPAPVPQRSNYLTASRFYCVETLCAPCGAVIAWTKFDKAESPTKILEWLNQVYPTEDSRPDYICIDKACLVLRTSIVNGSWTAWEKTTRFIVDSYHYVNHRTSDYLCRKWCNPAPLNGSAPNLVVVEKDKHGQQHYKRAFNTQVNIV